MTPIADDFEIKYANKVIKTRPLTKVEIRKMSPVVGDKVFVWQGINREDGIEGTVIEVAECHIGGELWSSKWPKLMTEFGEYIPDPRPLGDNWEVVLDDGVPPIQIVPMRIDELPGELGS